MRIKVGDVFGALTALTEPKTRKPGDRHTFCSFQCICGTVKDIRADNVYSGQTVSCGCVSASITSAWATKHGRTAAGVSAPEYRSWMSMIQRCTNPKNRSYLYYGARGIAVCQRWRDFTCFYADMGERPLGMTIERIDNSKGYEPGNCRWATHREQMQNTRQTGRVIVEGQVLSARSAAKVLGISEDRIYHRVRKYSVTHQQAVEFILKATRDLNLSTDGG